MSSQPQPPSSPPSNLQGKTTWFSSIGCVTTYPDRRDVFVGGALIGSFANGDYAGRNIQLIACLSASGVHRENLAKAFGISSRTLRKVVGRYEEGGLVAIVEPRKPKSRSTVTPKRYEKLCAWFNEGVTIDEACKRMRGRLSRPAVGRAHKRWADERKAREAKAAADHFEATRQQTIDDLLVVSSSDDRRKQRRATRTRGASDPTPTQSSSPRAAGTPRARDRSLDAVAGGPAQQVQHVGGWIMLAMLASLGLYRTAEALRAEVARSMVAQGKRFMMAGTLRVALDATVLSLTIAERTVEGVRRLATPTAPVLLRASGGTSPPAVRNALGRLARHAAGSFELLMTTLFIRDSEQRASSPERVVFYLDGHMRPYTGKKTIRKGWRMQDKRVRPGTTDYWVHDEDGRPVLRESSPEHESLSKRMLPIGDKLRRALCDEQVRVFLVFDRAGAFPGQMAELRDAGFEFATYERKPYRRFPVASFPHELTLGTQSIAYAEDSKKNLRNGRGRVRRIMLRMPDGEQVNILAVSTAPADEVIRAMLTRWARQENQFKHGVERWGINQLDGRQVQPYPQDAIIPNPARRRLDRALRVARIREGDALRKLAQLSEDHPNRLRQQQEIDVARGQQRDLEAERKATPTHAAVRDTELAGKLMQHTDEYKSVVDITRIALTNAESQLAAILAPRLPRPQEAKKALANLLGAPGRVNVTARRVTVTLQPAGTGPERRAFDHLLAELNARKLTLPGDDRGRPLRFQQEKR